MFRNFHGPSADAVWSTIATAFRTAGDVEMRDSRAGHILDLGNVCISIEDPRQRWVVSREPALNPAFAIAEVVWIVNGRNDAPFLNYFNRQLPSFAGQHSEYPGAYGYRLLSHLGFDQLERAYGALCGASNSRQVVLQIWDGGADLPDQDGNPSTSDVPCNVMSLLKIRGSKLDWTQVLRSNDFYLGLPHNLIQFTTLHEIMASWLDVSCGTFHLMTDCLHVYERDLAHLDTATIISPAKNTDSLALDKAASEESFKVLARIVEVIIDENASSAVVLAQLEECELPQSYKNLLAVLIAEGLRRRKEPSLAKDAMRLCTNRALLQAWERWIARLSDMRCSGYSEPVGHGPAKEHLKEVESHALLE